MVLRPKMKNTSKSEQVNALKSSSSQPGNFKVILTVILLGVVFGFAIEKGKVYLPRVILNQMLMRDFRMMKMFLSATTTSMLVFTFCYFVKPFHTIFNNIRKEEPVIGLIPLLLGAGLLGAGMAITGACPGTVFVQIGAGVSSAFFTLGGGFIGAFLYSILDTSSSFQKIRQKFKISASKMTLDQITNLPYSVVVLAVAILLAGFIAILEKFFPYVPESGNGTLFTQASWSPIASGMIVGFLNLPMIAIVHQTLGSATGFAGILGKLISIVSPSTEQQLPHLKCARVGDYWFQPFYYIGIILGGMISATISLHSNADSEGLGNLRSLIGGICIIFGSRMGGGCTSGHGISGFGQLFILSMFAVGAMFAGGIATAFALEGLGLN